jgi:hypothetical protein
MERGQNVRVLAIDHSAIAHINIAWRPYAVRTLVRPIYPAPIERDSHRIKRLGGLAVHVAGGPAEAALDLVPAHVHGVI